MLILGRKSRIIYAAAQVSLILADFVLQRLVNTERIVHTVKPPYNKHLDTRNPWFPLEEPVKSDA